MADSPKELDPEQVKVAMVQAAMMEELGVGRRDALPLENKKGLKKHVDLDKLNAGIKTNVRAAHWKNATFDDVDPAELVLDSMNCGQSHRERMKATLAEISSGISGRGGNDSRGRGGVDRNNILVSRRGRSAHPSRAKYLSPDIAFSHLGSSSRSSLQPPIRVSPHGSHMQAVLLISPKVSQSNPQSLVSNPNPKPNLSFLDKRSVNDLPFAQNTSSNGSAGASRSKAPKHSGNSRSNRASQFTVELADPDEFMRLAAKKDQFQYSHSMAQPQPPVKEPRVMIEAFTANAQKVAAGGRSEVLHDYECKVDKKVHMNKHVESPVRGRTRIIECRIDKMAPTVIEVVDSSDKILFKQSLQALTRHICSSSTVSFDSIEPEGTTRWTLRFPQAWKATSFFEALLSSKPQLPSKPLRTGNAHERGQDELGTENQETLLSLSVESGKFSQEMPSKYMQDMEGLLFEVDDASRDSNLHDVRRKDPQLDQVLSTATHQITSTSMNVNTKGLQSLQFPGGPDSKAEHFSAPNELMLDVTKFRAFGGGLMSSRYTGAEVILQNTLEDSSPTCQNLSGDYEKAYNKEINNKSLASVDYISAASTPPSHSCTSDTQGLEIPPAKSPVIPQQPPVKYHMRYSADEMKSWRGSACVVDLNLMRDWIPNWKPTAPAKEPCRKTAYLPSVIVDENRHHSEVMRYGIGKVEGEAIDCSLVYSPEGSKQAASTSNLAQPQMSEAQTTNRQVNAIEHLKICGLAKSRCTDPLSNKASMERERNPMDQEHADSFTASTRVSSESSYHNSGNTPEPSKYKTVDELETGSLNSSKGLNVASASKIGMNSRRSDKFPESFNGGFLQTKPLLGLSSSRFATSSTPSISATLIPSNAPQVTSSSTKSGKQTNRAESKSRPTNIGKHKGKEQLPIKPTILPVPVFTAITKSTGTLCTIERGTFVSFTVPTNQFHHLPPTSRVLKGLSSSRFADTITNVQKSVAQTNATLKRSESFLSQGSRESESTVKVSTSAKVSSNHNAVSVASIQNSITHRSRLSTDSTFSTASFATAMEDLEVDDRFEFSQMDSNDVALFEGLQADIGQISLHHMPSQKLGASHTTGGASEMQMTLPDNSPSGKSRPNVLPGTQGEPIPVRIGQGSLSPPQSTVVNNTTPTKISGVRPSDAPIFKPANLVATKKTSPLEMKRRGLSFSRWANDVTTDVHPRVTSQAHMGSTGSSSRRLRLSIPSPPDPPNSGKASNTSNNFNNQIISLSAEPAPVVYQTVLVPDESRPGHFKEVCGIVKSSNAPIVAHNPPRNY